MMESEVEFQDFVLLHKPQLLSSHIPESHWNCLWKKLKNEVSSGLSDNWGTFQVSLQANLFLTLARFREAKLLVTICISTDFRRGDRVQFGAS